MWVRVAVVVGLVAATVRCGPAAEKCGAEICTKEQRCTASKTCVTDNPPSLTVDAPTMGMVVNATTVTVSGTASDDDDTGLAVDVSTNKTTWVLAKLGSGGTFSVQLQLPALDASAATVTTRARDSHGHEVLVTRTINVDNQPPVCTITSPMMGSSVTATGTLMVTMTASDGSQMLLNPQISTDGAATFAIPQANVTDFTYAWALASENGEVHELVFKVDDPNGHSCEARVTTTVDNVKPTIAFSTPLSSALLGTPFFTTGGLVEGTASDGVRPLKSVTYDFADGAGPRMATLSLSGNKLWSVHVTQPAGDDYKQHNTTAVVTDLAGNTATATLTVTVDVKPPLLTITGPAPGAKLNITNFPASNNVPLAWQLSDGDSILNIGIAYPDGGFASPPVLPTSPTDNPKAYTAVLKANDRAGNTATQSVSFTVDRVQPTITLTTPGNDVRMFVGPASADYSEPMMGGDGLTSNPFAAGTWTTTTHFQLANLLKDKVYAVTSGPATDLHGNPLAPLSYRFHTETWQPGSGGTLTSGYKRVFDATTDEEGTLNVVGERAVGNAVDWIQFDRVTGAPTIVETNPTPTLLLKLVAARTVQSDLTSRRLAGVTVNAGGVDTVKYNINGGAPTAIVGTANAFIPTPAFAAEGTGLAEFGVIQGGFYKRTGRANVAVTLTTIDQLHISDTHWQLVSHNGGGTDSQDYGCGPTCGMSAVKSLGGFSAGTPNAAISQMCAIHGYLASAVEKTTMFRWQPSCGGPTNACAPDITENNNFDQVVADPLNDGTFYGYNADGLGNYQVKKRVLSSALCAGVITNVGAPIFVGTIQGIPRLVVIRGVPGLIFPNANNLNYVNP